MGFNLGTATGTIRLDTSQVGADIAAAQRTIQSGLGGISGAFQGVGSTLQNIGGSIRNIGTQTTLAFAPITAAVTQGIFAFSSFDAMLTEIAARTGATADEMETVRQTALQMGQDTAFSSTQAADAMLQLLSSGYDLTETLSALPDVLNLAAAGTLDLGFAADAVTDILAQYQMGADDARIVTDALAKASGSSSATMQDLIAAFANVGPIAKSFGLSVEDTAAVLAVFSENGIKGAEAGTQLKSMLTNMARNTDDVTGMWDELGISLYDAEGNFRNINDVIKDLNVALDGVSDERRNEVIQTLAGSYGRMGLEALLATEGIDGMKEAMYGVDDATKRLADKLGITIDNMDGAADAATLAAAKQKSFRGVANQLGSTLETLSINIIGPLVEEYLKPLIATVTDVLNQFNAWIVANEDAARVIGLVLAAVAIIGPVLVVLGTIISAVGTALGAIGAVLGVVGAVIGLVLSPIGLLIAAIVALGIAYKENFLGFGDAVDSVVSALGEGIQHIIRFVGDLVKVFQEGGLGEAFRFFLDSLSSGIGDIGNWVLTNIIMPLVAAITSYIGSGQLWEDAQRLGNSIWGAIKAGAALVSELGTWVLDNIIVPLANAVISYVGSGELWEAIKSLGGSIFDALIAGAGELLEIGTWLGDNLISPLATAVMSYVGSGELWEDVKSLGGSIFDAMGVGLTALGDLAVWVGENLITPVANAVISYVGSGELWENVKGLGTSLFDAFIEGIHTYGDIAVWVGENIIVPLATAIETYFTSGAAWENFKIFGSKLLEGIGQGIVLIGDINTWVLNNIITPLATALFNFIASGQAWETSKQIGSGIMTAISTGLSASGDVSTWIYTNLINPLNQAIIGFVQPGGGLYNAAQRIGSDILKAASHPMNDIAGWINTNLITPLSNAISAGADAVYGSAQAVGNKIINGIADGISALSGIVQTAINAAIPDSFDLRIGKIELPYGAGSIDVGTLTIRLPNPFQGGGYTGDLPTDAIAGVVHGGEFVFPAPMVRSGMPDLAGLMGQALQRFGLAAGGAGGGAVYNFNIAPEVLRNDPGIQERVSWLADEIQNRIRTQ